MKVGVRQAVGRATLFLALVSGTHCSDPLSPGSQGAGYYFDYTQLPLEVATLDLERQPNDRIAQHGDVIAVVNGNRIQLLNISQARAPELLHTLEWSQYNPFIGLTETHLVVLDSEGLHLIDRVDLDLSPVTILDFEDGVVPRALVVDDWCFFSTEISGQHTTRILDLVDPTKPVTVATFDFSSFLTDVGRDQNLLVLATGAGVHFFDASQPTQLEHLSTVAEERAYRYVTMANGFAYITGGGWSGSGLTTFNIQDPRNPVPVGSSLTPSGYGPMQIDGSRLVVRTRNHVSFIDVVDRQQPRHIGSIAAEGSGWMQFDGEHLWTLGQALRVFSMNDELTSPVLGEQGVNAAWFDAHLEGTVLYAYRADGYFRLNVSDPTLPIPYETIPGLRRVRAYGNGRAFMLNSGKEIGINVLATGHPLATIDVSPFLAREHDEIFDLAVHEYQLYVVIRGESAINYKVLAFDVSHPESPLLLGELERPGDPFARLGHLYQVGDRLFLSVDEGRNGAIDILDMGRMAQPVLTTVKTDLRFYVWTRMLSHREFLYVSADDDFVVYDMRDGVVEVMRVPSPGQIRGFAVHQGLLYTSTTDALLISDLSNPARPRQIASRGYSSRNGGEGVLIGNGFLIALNDDNVETWPLHAPE